MKIKMALRVLAGLCLASGSTGVWAAALTLVDVAPGAEVQQTNNNPCIFGDASCDPGLLGTYTQFPTGGGSQTYQESQSYTVGTVIGAVGAVFDVGIDVNTTNAASDLLDYFRVYVNNVLLYQYEGDQNIALADQLKNGTGWSDWRLMSVDLNNIAANAIVRFDVRVLNAVDGREQFFLINSRQQVPEPGTLALLGLGMLAAGIRRRAKR